jgi:hypothetical protein
LASTPDAQAPPCQGTQAAGTYALDTEVQKFTEGPSCEMQQEQAKVVDNDQKEVQQGLRGEFEVE